MTTPLEDFLSWEAYIREEVDHIKSILAQRLSDEPEALIKDLEDVEAWNARAGFLLAEASSYLDKARPFYLPERNGNTEADRKAIADMEMADIRKFRDYVEVLTDSIKQRLILGSSILAYYRQFRDPVQPQNQAQVTKKVAGSSNFNPW
jgi:hypothetical protein